MSTFFTFQHVYRWDDREKNYSSKLDYADIDDAVSKAYGVLDLDNDLQHINIYIAGGWKTTLIRTVSRQGVMIPRALV